MPGRLYTMDGYKHCKVLDIYKSMGPDAVVDQQDRHMSRLEKG